MAYETWFMKFLYSMNAKKLSVFLEHSLAQGILNRYLIKFEVKHAFNSINLIRLLLQATRKSKPCVKTSQTA